MSDFPVFSFGDEVYLTDSKRQVHIFELKEGGLVRSAPFDDVYEQIKSKGRFTRTRLQSFDAPTFLKFPKLINGRGAEESLACYLGMKVVDDAEEKDEQYKWYSFKVNADILRDGSLEVEEIEADPGLPKEKILEFFRVHKFDSRPVPAVFEKWNLGEQYFFFRKSDEGLARKEKEEERAQQRREYERHLTADTIEGVYIPKDLGECFAELDKLLPEVERGEMRALPKREDMIQYHLGLGTWMRNNWGLWGGSRLQKYFIDRGVRHPESMSSVILYYYYDWLNGRREAWRGWEKDPKGK